MTSSRICSIMTLVQPYGFVDWRGRSSANGGSFAAPAGRKARYRILEHGRGCGRDCECGGGLQAGPEVQLQVVAGEYKRGVQLYGCVAGFRLTSGYAALGRA